MQCVANAAFASRRPDPSGALADGPAANRRPGPCLESRRRQVHTAAGPVESDGFERGRESERGAAPDGPLERLAPLVARAARRVLLSPAADPLLDADDLEQEIWWRLLSRAGGPPDLADDASSRSYLRRVAASVVQSHRRARCAARRGGGAIASSDVEPHARSLDPEQLAAHRQRLDIAARAAIAATPPPLRERRARILRLAWIEGYQPDEIVAALPHGTRSGVNTVLFRARAAARAADGREAVGRS